MRVLCLIVQPGTVHPRIVQAGAAAAERKNVPKLDCDWLGLSGFVEAFSPTVIYWLL